MKQLAKEARNAYMREYRAKNKDKQREYYKSYYESHREDIKKNNENYWLRKSQEQQG